ncbi:DUF6162 family protein [Sinorhizobium meliloti]|uniref:Uncharacterized protein n=1 Tax=Rhizobium meliloti TaxID=382 RepID=A0A2J0YU25_RHIML|nr:hypothetical protein [Sinorhizobium meliloti]PJR09902.1 hypothetical protein CEJ86_30280 [Sinorhizobium meliloti]
MGASLTITPLTGQRETGLLATIAAALVAGVVLYGQTRPPQGAMPPLTEWQVSAFTDLSSVDQAIHSALLPALEEAYWAYKGEGFWPTAQFLDEALLPPFHHDHFWEDNGRVEWTLYTNEALGAADQGFIYYMGVNGQAKAQSAYLAVINHAHLNAVDANQFDIWVHPNASAPRPSGMKQQSLILEGWRQVKTHTGADEVARIKG